MQIFEQFVALGRKLCIPLSNTEQLVCSALLTPQETVISGTLSDLHIIAWKFIILAMVKVETDQIKFDRNQVWGSAVRYLRKNVQLVLCVPWLLGILGHLECLYGAGIRPAWRVSWYVCARTRINRSPPRSSRRVPFLGADPPRRGQRAAMPNANPTPADLGEVYVWDDGAEAPRMRRQDEATVDGVDPKEYNLFVVCPAIGVRTEHASTECRLASRPLADPFAHACAACEGIHPRQREDGLALAHVLQEVQLLLRHRACNAAATVDVHASAVTPVGQGLRGARQARLSKRERARPWRHHGRLAGALGGRSMEGVAHDAQERRQGGQCISRLGWCLGDLGSHQGCMLHSHMPPHLPHVPHVCRDH